MAWPMPSRRCSMSLAISVGRTAEDRARNLLSVQMARAKSVATKADLASPDRWRLVPTFSHTGRFCRTRIRVCGTSRARLLECTPPLTRQ